MIRSVSLAVLLSAVPTAAFACPVCFGQNDSAMASGTNMGIFFMLGLVALMFAAFASFFLVLMRRARLARRTAASGPATAGLKGPRYTDYADQEGTA